jgi:hypothetical protein
MHGEGRWETVQVPEPTTNKPFPQKGDGYWIRITESCKKKVEEIGRAALLVFDGSSVLA